MRNKTHLLLVVKIQKFTTYAPFLPLFRLIFSRENRPTSLPACPSPSERTFSIFSVLETIIYLTLYKKASAFVAGVD